MIHIIPVGACICITALNLRGYYIGGELSGWSGQDTEKLAGLQFAAKLHELTMNASIATLLFSYIRYQVTFAGGLPFGAVFAGLQFKDLSFLWSMELFGAAKAKAFRRRWTLFVLIIGCVLLGVSVGPSSANILKPRLDWWEAGGSDFWINATHADLYPLEYIGSQVPSSCASYNGDASCPSGDWTTLNSHYMSFWGQLQNGTLESNKFPYSGSVSGSQSIRSLSIHDRSPYEIYPGANTMASVSYSVVADAVAALGQLWKIAAWNVGHDWRYKWRHGDNFTVAALQPAVIVRCHQNTSSIKLPTFGNYTLAFYNLSDSAAFSQNGDYPLIPYENIFLASVIDSAISGRAPLLSWVDLPNPTFGNASIGMAVVIPEQQGANATVNLCTVAATVGPAISQGVPDETKFVSSILPADIQTWEKLSIEPSWAEYLFPMDPVTNVSIFDQMLEAAGLWKLPADPTIGTNNVLYVLETLFALSIANGLARVNYYTLIAGELKGDDYTWMRQMMPVNSYIGYGGNAFDLAGQSVETVTQFTLKVQAFGWAYSSRGSTTILSIIILLIYCTLAIMHSVYMVWTGLSSSSWDSISEITTLAMNSDQSSKLINTGAGIETSAVFQEIIHVASDGDRLQFVFDDLPRGVEKVEKDVYYC